MTDLTDRADEELRKALIAHAQVHGLLDEDEMLDEFVVVASWQKIEDDGKSRYSIQTERVGRTRNHIIVGLLRYGEALVLGDAQEGA